MKDFSKTGNVFGIIFAWLLSIVLVVMLIAAPLTMSALSMLSMNNITKVVSDVLTAQLPTEDERAAEPGITLLSEQTVVSQVPDGTEELPDEYEQVGGEFLSGIFGDQLKPEDIEKILGSDLVKDFVKTYTDGMVDAITGKPARNQFDAESIKTFAGEHIDDVVDLAIQIIPEFADMDIDEVKAMITKMVDESAQDLADALPKPEKVVEDLLENTPELELILKIIGRRNAIKWAMIGVVFLLSALIFVCRLPGLRGFRWLATDLFVGSGFGVVISVALLVLRPMLLSSMDKQIVGVAGSILSVFTTGMIIRTAVMLVSAVGMLVAYIFVKKALAKKAAVPEEQVTEVTENVCV